MSGVSSASYLSAAPNWLDDAYSSIQAQKKNNGGLMGMLNSARGGNSIKDYLKRSANTANSFALISQNDISNATALITQLAGQNIERQNEKQMQKVLQICSVRKPL